MSPLFGSQAAAGLRVSLGTRGLIFFLALFAIHILFSYLPQSSFILLLGHN